MKYATAVLAAFSCLCLALPASAATVEAQGGRVFIDRGQGYTEIAGSTSARAGDVVMASAGGRGVIVYDDGCRQVVEVGAIVVVGQVAPCTTGEVLSDNVFLYTGLVVVGVVGAVVALSDDDDQNRDRCITQCE